MKCLYRTLILIFVFTLAFSSFVFSARKAAAVDNNFGLDATAKQAFGDTSIPHSPESVDPTTTVGRIIGIVLSFVGIIFLILVIYGGFIWMTAGGNEEKIKKSIDLVMQAGIGLAIVLAAYLLTKYVGNAIINALK